MNIFGTFEHSIEVEQALAMLENEVIPYEQILVVTMTERPADMPITGRTDSLNSNAFEVGIACATGLAVIGTCAGFVLTWGPILCGLIAAGLGFVIGFFIYFFARRGVYRFRQARIPAILVVVQCTKEQAHHVKSAMWKYKALSVGQRHKPNISPPPTPG